MKTQIHSLSFMKKTRGKPRLTIEKYHSDQLKSLDDMILELSFKVEKDKSFMPIGVHRLKELKDERILLKMMGEPCLYSCYNYIGSLNLFRRHKRLGLIPEMEIL